MAGQTIKLYPDSGTDAAKLQGFPVSTTDPTSGNVLVYDQATRQWIPVSKATAGLAELSGGTFSGNVVLDGVANTAPNQTAASDSSILTRTLGDARYGNLTIVRLTSDFTVNNNAAEQVVTGWAQANLALAASSTYIIDGIANITATTGGWRIISYWDYGTGGIGSHNSLYFNGNAASPISTIADGRNPMTAGVATAFASSGTIGGARMNWMIRTGTGSPYIEIKFRQNTADASNTSIKAGSFISIRKLQ